MKALLAICLIWMLTVPFIGQAQSIDRQVISGWGSIIATDAGGVTASGYRVDNFYSAGLTVISGFEQPDTTNFLSIATSENYSFEVFPNPFSTFINITFKDHEPTQVQLLNIVGQVVLQKTGKGKLTIDNINLPSGPYILKVVNSTGQSSSIKLLKI